MVVNVAHRILSAARLGITKSATIRNMSGSVSQAKVLLYKEYGEPIKVLEVAKQSVNAPQENQVTVKWLLSPVNPADMVTLQGLYPSRPPLPAIPGNEGVGEVIAVGPKVQEFKVGDKVVPSGVNLGTWRTVGTHQFEEIMKVPDYLGMVEASMLKVNPCTAYRMLKDFVPLKPGDTVIQNGGNSAVGLLVIQLCRNWNYKSVSIVRDRPNIKELKEQMKKLGADEVLTEQEVRTTEIFKSKKLPQPMLALNCIGGQNALEMSRHIAKNGIMVTYGGMAKEPLTVPMSAMIFKNLSFKGFWMTAWSNENMESPERIVMIDELSTMFRDKKLEVPPYKLVPFSDYKEAIENAMRPSGKTGLKYILDMSKE